MRTYCKIPKISPGAYIFQRPFFGGAYLRRGLSMEGKLHFKISWTSLIIGSKFSVFALFYFVFQGNFPSTSSWGAYIWRDDLTESFLLYRFGGAYIWRGLYMEGLIFRKITVFILKFPIGSYFTKMNAEKNIQPEKRSSLAFSQ